MCGVYGRGSLWSVFFIFFQLKYACNIRKPPPQQSFQKATKVKVVNTEKHASGGQLKHKNKYQEIIQSH